MPRPKRMVGEERAYEILKATNRGVLSMVDVDGLPYGTPVNAVYCPEEHCLYFHCSNEGRRWEALHANPHVSYSAVASERIVGSRFITHYESVIVEGIVHFVEGDEEVKRTLALMTEMLAPGELEKRPKVIDAYFADVAMVRVSIERIHGKVNMDK